jgi:hypothetical protein
MRIGPSFIKRPRKSVRNRIRTPMIIMWGISIRARTLGMRRRGTTHSAGSDRMGTTKYLLVHHGGLPVGIHYDFNAFFFAGSSIVFVPGFSRDTLGRSHGFHHGTCHGLVIL